MLHENRHDGDRYQQGYHAEQYLQRPADVVFALVAFREAIHGGAQMRSSTSTSHTMGK